MEPMVEQGPTEQDGRSALRDHAIARALLARERYGPEIDDTAIMRMIDDREVVRFPLGIRFASDGLQKGEFAHAEPLGDHPKQGFCLFIHPVFEHRRADWPALIAYHIPPVNYGDIAEADDCEAFGAALLGLEVDAYYARLCSLADLVA